MSLFGTLGDYVRYFSMLGTDAADKPDTKSPTVVSWQEDLTLVRALFGGWKTLYPRRALYLPQHPKEDPQDYYIRANRRTFYNGFGRTVRALAASPFATPPARDGIPPAIVALYDDDIDNQGTNGDTFVHDVFQDALVTGMGGIFVDMPQLVRAEGAPEATRADELDAGIRPYWCAVPKDKIVSFRVDVENGRQLLGQFVFWQERQEPKGKYGVRIVEQLREYRRLPAVAGATNKPTVLFEWWERDAGKAKWVSVNSGELPNVTEIPFAQIYTERRGFMDSAPPLMDLANVNLLHYQTSSDMYHSVHIANVPFLFGGGFDEQDLQIGPNRAVVLQGVKSDEAWLRWVEHTGAQIGSTRACLADLEEQMAHLGLGMLQRKSRAAETAEKATLDRKDQESTLSAAVGELENGLEQALFYTAQYLGLAAGGRLSFTRAFEQPAAAARTENQGQPQDPKEPKGPGETNNPRTTN